MTPVGRFVGAEPWLDPLKRRNVCRTHRGQDIVPRR
jgi:hypothetical protein